MNLNNKDVKSYVADIVMPFTITMFSKRRTGKSFMCRNIVYELCEQKKVDVVFVLSNTAHLTSDYNFVQKPYIKKFSEEFIGDVMKSQEGIKDKKKRPHILLIIDDCVGNTKNKQESSMNSSIISELYMLGRHFNISLIFINQSITNSTSTQVRNNSDYSFFSRLNRNQLESMYEAISVLDKREFIETVYNNTNDFQFCLYDATKNSIDVREFMFRIKANEVNFFIKQ